jgi:hypothetical protein
VGVQDNSAAQVYQPIPLFHLAYPDSIEDIEVRGSERISYLIPAMVKSSTGAQAEVQVRDLSSQPVNGRSTVADRP